MGTFILHLPAVGENKNQWSNVSVSEFFIFCYDLIMKSFQVKIVKVLGEGGFSFVYLAQDEQSGVCAFAFHCVDEMSH